MLGNYLKRAEAKADMTDQQTIVRCRECKYWVKIKQDKHSGICKNSDVSEMITVSTLFHPKFPDSLK